MRVAPSNLLWSSTQRQQAHYQSFPPPCLSNKYTQTATLQAHQGCVNRMAWSPQGNCLASVSDDCTLRLWRMTDIVAPRDSAETVVSVDPMITVETEHRANMFGVAFLEFGDSEDLSFATGAMDHAVMTHRLSHPNLKKYTCHSDRVKQVISDLDNGNVFYSASEDGTIRRFDLREDVDCCGDLGEHKDAVCRSKIIDLSDLGKRNEPSGIRIAGMFLSMGEDSGFKSLVMNPVRRNFIATGCSDPFIRIFDLRMVKAEKSQPFSMHSPFHLKKSQTSQTGTEDSKSLDEDRLVHSTFVNFSNLGEQIVASYSSEQIYTFEWLKAETDGIGIKFDNVLVKNSNLEHHLIALKDKAYKCLSSNRLVSAISYYSQAINLLPSQSQTARFGNQPSNRLRSILLNNRAFCFLRRNWRGDLEAALRDSEEGILVDPSYIKVRQRYLDALYKLKLRERCIRSSKAFQKLFPENKEAFSKYIVEETPADDECISEDEKLSHEIVYRPSHFINRFCGHCNVQTDIKEVTFSSNDAYVMSGSDDGYVYIWDARNGNICNLIYGGEEVVNCVQPHPFLPLMATSGIESDIRVFDPYMLNSPLVEVDAEEVFAEQLKSNARSLHASWSSSMTNRIGLFNLLMQAGLGRQ